MNSAAWIYYWCVCVCVCVGGGGGGGGDKCVIQSNIPLSCSQAIAQLFAWESLRMRLLSNTLTQ